MVEIKRCLDTYALIEIAKGNPKFAEYLNYQFIICDLTLAEFYGVILREEGEKVADYWFKKLENYALSADLETLIEAIKFRQANKKSNISLSLYYSDSLRIKALVHIFKIFMGLC